MPGRLFLISLRLRFNGAESGLRVPQRHVKSCSHRMNLKVCSTSKSRASSLTHDHRHTTASGGGAVRRRRPAVRLALLGALPGRPGSVARILTSAFPDSHSPGITLLVWPLVLEPAAKRALVSLAFGRPGTSMLQVRKSLARSRPGCGII